MARINADLLEALVAKLGSTRSAYRRIQDVQHETFLERDLAALVAGSRLKISINRYSTAAQREQIRGHLGAAPARGAALPPPVTAPAPAPRTRGKVSKSRKKDNSVFVIGGRDLALTESMFALLDALGCRPVEFHQAVARVPRTGNPFVGQVLDRAFEQVQALVVLFSPDDEAKLKDQFLKPSGDVGERQLRGQARQNVVFEAGMAMGRHEEKTIMAQVGDMKSFSDVAGRHMVHLDDSFESRRDFATRLGRICKVDTSGTRWTKVGKFAPTGPAPTHHKNVR
jgi:predicted nucleotide-binding protein